jgi:hypothetical protein
MHFRFGAVVARVVAVLGVLLLFGLACQLAAAMLGPVLPEKLVAAIDEGWSLLTGIVSPAIGGFMALCIVATAWYVIVGRGRG